MTEAVLRPERRISLLWAAPLVALVAAGWLGWSAWRDRGTEITVLLPDGHGLKIGDAVRYRGIDVGEVEDVRLSDDLLGVRVDVRLRAQADHLARAGTRFWVVRPELGLGGVQGVETLLRPRYLAVMAGPSDAPGASPARLREFVGLPQPPVVETVDPDDLEVIVEAARRGSLRRGAPVTFRQIRVGTVLSVGVASDGGSVEARVLVRKAYRGLVREGTRFWDVGGVRADLGLRGLSMEIESLEEFVTGGVALATPPPDRAGAEARTGHRFPLFARPRDEWLSWEPTVPVGSSLLPPGATLPQPLRATVGWKQGFIVKGDRSRQGWVLQTEAGLLGPADLLAPSVAAGDPEAAGTAELHVAGRTVSLTAERVRANGALAVLEMSVDEAIWRHDAIRSPAAPEDCIAVADPTSPPLPLAASRLKAAEGAWRVDPAVPVDAAWHGASVVSRGDGRLVGVLLVGEDEIRVALVTGGMPGAE